VRQKRFPNPQFGNRRDNNDQPGSSFMFDGELDADVNEKPFTSPHSSEHMSYFEAGTEFTVAVEPADALVSSVREKPFALRLGQLSTWYVSRRRAQEN
jgi:hypothetical protein